MHHDAERSYHAVLHECERDVRAERDVVEIFQKFDLNPARELTLAVETRTEGKGNFFRRRSLWHVHEEIEKDFEPLGIKPRECGFECIAVECKEAAHGILHLHFT